MVCEEPFRVFFPLGIVVSMVGVGLWPMLYAGWLSFPPHVPHARLMIEGFFGAFVIGFLGTALPRMMETASLRRVELGVLLLLYLGAVGSQVAGKVAPGDGFFLATLVVFFSFVGRRFLFSRKDLPPPGFALAVMGLLGAMAGVVILLVGQFVTIAFFWQKLGELLLYEGFVLLPILGVGVFFFPRLLGMKSDERCPETVSPTPEWRRRALIAVGCGLVVWVSFGLEAATLVREGRFLRIAVAAAFLLWRVPLFRRTGTKATVAFGLRAAVVMMLAGLLATGVFPIYQKGFDHLMFVGGFGLVALCVASRVVLGHAERLDLVTGRSMSLRWVIALVLLAAATRAIADPLPHIAVSHHMYAAALWVAATATWGWWVFGRRS